MEFTVATVGPCRKKVTVKVPTERIREEYDKQFQEINKSFALPGFRPGHAPRKILERRFGSRLGDEVKGNLVKAAMEQLVEEKKVQPLAAPEIDVDALAFDREKPFEFEFELLTRPEFDTPAYKGLEAKVPAAEVSDEEVDRAVRAMLRRRAKLETVGDASLAEDDVAVLDWAARDGDSVEAHDEGVYYPLGRGVMGGFVVPGLDALLVGQRPGAEAQLDVEVLPDDPREELRGRSLRLTATLREVKRYVAPPIDAEFLKSHDFDDETEMRAEIRKRLVRAKRREAEVAAEGRLVEQLLEKIDVSLPEGFVEKELESWAARKRIQGEAEGIAEEEIAKVIDAARGDAKRAIEQDMKRFFVLDRIADAEGIEVTEAELVQAIRDIAAATGRPEEDVLASFRDQGRLSELRSHVRHRKAREAIRSHATLVEQAPPPAPPGKAEAPKPDAPKKRK
jgi:trigger factor